MSLEESLKAMKSDLADAMYELSHCQDYIAALEEKLKEVISEEEVEKIKGEC